MSVPMSEGSSGAAMEPVVVEAMLGGYEAGLTEDAQVGMMAANRAAQMEAAAVMHSR